MKKSTAEITSLEITSDNPIHQRLFFAYTCAKEYLEGDILELGCGSGRGIEEVKSHVSTYTAIDKNDFHLGNLAKQYPDFTFHNSSFPPLTQCKENSFDRVITFQVIEHIQDDHNFMKEIHRVLKPGGKALITTPNIDTRLSRNPWHIREYKAQELYNLGKKYFNNVEIKGITGNEKVMEYYERNKVSVNKIMKWDFLNLQYILPASILKLPYEYLNRKNRNSLKDADDELVKSIHYSDYHVIDDANKGLDLFLIVEK